MDDAIARAQGDATAVGDELGQSAVRDHLAEWWASSVEPFKV